MASRLMEFEPTLLNDNTEVKVLVSPKQSPNSSFTVNFVDNGTDDTINLDGNANIVEYNRLISKFRQLPSDLFVNQILSDYSQSEVQLEETRTMLFETLQQSEDFPLDRNSVMKRRLHSRTGDTVAIKLARDIYTILWVIEGADFSELNPIISSTHRRDRSKSVQIRAFVSNNNNCNTDVNDTNRLNGVMSHLQADMLLL